MSDIFAELLELTEIENVPEEVRKFVHHTGERPGYADTWDFYSYSYDRAFTELAKLAERDLRMADQLAAPLFFLGRHSMELTIKATILEFAHTDKKPPELVGHGLLPLWSQLVGYMERFETPAHDEWGVFCGKLISHIHEFDPGGDRFRYPAARGGEPFVPARIELRGLIRAQWHVCMYCEGSREMHDALSSTSHQ